MISSAVTNRYANALVDVVLSPDSGVTPEQAIEQVRAFDGAAKSSPELRAVLASPAVSVVRKRVVIRLIADMLGLARVIRNFILVVSDHRRMAGLSQTAGAFELLLGERMGFTQAEVKSAIELTEAQRGELSAHLGKLAGGAVRVRFEIDPDLIGGVTARIGSTVFDGSVRGQLARMRVRLAGAHASAK